MTIDGEFFPFRNLQSCSAAPTAGRKGLSADGVVDILGRASVDDRRSGHIPSREVGRFHFARFLADGGGRTTRPTEWTEESAQIWAVRFASPCSSWPLSLGPSAF